ncbi:MAG: ABC transporter permease subunit, partial [Phascolarctobacterium sp.]|nr:ABC transporter permease subunit [Phascolarctobacterium sp.]
MDYIIRIIPQLLEGGVVTGQVFLITIVLSVPIGILLALGRVLSIGILQKIIAFYVWVLRGTMLMLQLIFVYYALPTVGILYVDFEAAIVSNVFNYSAYFCEIF